jgi:hypothetical protein
MIGAGIELGPHTERCIYLVDARALLDKLLGQRFGGRGETEPLHELKQRVRTRARHGRRVPAPRKGDQLHE